MAAAWIADGLPLPDDPDDALWAHLLVEAARAASFDRDEVLHEHADGAALLDAARLGAATRRRSARTRRRRTTARRYAGGGTIYLCAVDNDRMGVSLIQSNAAGFGVDAGRAVDRHLPAEPRPRLLASSPATRRRTARDGGRRTRCRRRSSPRDDGSLDMVIGTMGGDAQPQIVLQLLARLLHNGENVGDAIAAPRWVLSGAPPFGNGFDTWRARGAVQVHLEDTAPRVVGDRASRARP